nr:RDD family protein [Bifidobacterium mellis]
MAVACVISAWSARNGQSWAHRLLKLQVCDQDSNLPISGLRMGVREIAHLADFASLFIGFLWPLWDGRGQTFADKIMGTTVTRKQ